MDRSAAIETFVRVVDAGSFSAAAGELNIGQPSVSQIIAQLDAELRERERRFREVQMAILPPSNLPETLVEEAESCTWFHTASPDADSKRGIR